MTLGNTNTCSGPSDLKITDLRVADLAGAHVRSTLIRIDANQRIFGLGEVRDGQICPVDRPGPGIGVDESLAARYPRREEVNSWTQTRIPGGTLVRP